MNEDKLFLITLETCETFLNDKYSEAIKENNVIEIETLNVRLETLEIIKMVFYEVLRLRGD